MNAVKTSARPNPGDLIAEFERLGKSNGFRLQTMGTAAGFPLLAMTKRTAGVRPRIYLSSGIHGDEPAGPAALVNLLNGNFFDDRAQWFVCPLLNPGGFVHGQRENPDGVDLNRDYRSIPQSTECRAHIAWLQFQPRFDVHICVHEDWESVGFYMYELNSLRKRSLAENVIAAVSKVCPIDHSPFIDDRTSVGGIVRPVDEPEVRELWPESIYLRSQYSQLGYTIETPSTFPLHQRVAAHVAAITEIVNGTVRDFNKTV